MGDQVVNGLVWRSRWLPVGACLLVACMALILSLVGGSSSRVASAGPEVHIYIVAGSLKFADGSDARTANITTGTTVTWTNQDNKAHTITSNGCAWDCASSELSPGESLSVTFNTAGTYRYFCEFHSWWNPLEDGTIIVAQAPTPTSTPTITPTITPTPTATVPPRIGVSPPSVNFLTDPTMIPWPQRIDVRNDGGGSFNWQIANATALPSWLLVTPVAGGANTPIAVNVLKSTAMTAVAGTGSDRMSTTLTIQPDYNPNDSRSVAVTFIYAPTPLPHNYLPSISNNGPN